MVTAYVGRAIALVAFGVGLAAIWVHVAQGSSYWDITSHSIGIAMLVLAIVAGAGLLIALLLRDDRIWIIGGLSLGGLFLFVPLSAFGQGSTSQLDAGAWLGMTAFALFGVAAALTTFPGALRRPVAAARVQEPPAPPPGA